MEVITCVKDRTGPGLLLPLAGVSWFQKPGQGSFPASFSLSCEPPTLLQDPRKGPDLFWAGMSPLALSLLKKSPLSASHLENLCEHLLCVPQRGEDTKEWDLGSTLQFLSEKETDDAGVGVKCGQEGHRGLQGQEEQHLIQSG